MTDRPTPETDAMIETDAHRIEEYSAPLTAYCRMCELARTLERERDEWRKKAVDLHARHKNALEDIEAEMQACEEARDAAEKAKAYKRVMKEDNAKLRRELATERALGDRLANALSIALGESDISNAAYDAWEEARK